MTARPLQILYLYRLHDVDAMRAALAHHLYALTNAGTPHRILYHNAVEGVPAWLRALRFDAVVLHTTFLGMRWADVFPHWKWRTRWVADLDVPKLALPQDEYDHSELLDEWLLELGVTDVFSVFDADLRATLYPLGHERLRFHRCFTGYIDDGSAERLARRLVPHGDRPYDVVYRASRLPFRFGSHGQLKHRIGAATLDLAARHGLRVDVSTRVEDVVEGDAWLDFMMSGRATVGAESGSSAVDRRGELGARIDALLRTNPALPFDDVGARLPPGWDDHAFYAVSPRHFEAVTTKTAQILVEGRYDDVLEPGRHYLPVRRDLSDLGDALEQAKDARLLERLAETAYEDVYRSGRYGYRRFAAQLEAVLAEAAELPSRPVAPRAWRAADRALAVEAALRRRRPRTLRRLVEAPGSSVTKGVATLRLALRSPAERALLVGFLRARRARGGLTLQHLFADLLRLGLLREARPFRVVAALEEDRRKLVLYSIPVDAADGAGSTAEDVTTAIRGGRVTTIVWDHTAVGVSIALPLEGGRAIDVKVGAAGTHRFEALAALARSYPDRTAQALASVLDGGGDARRPYASRP